LDLEALDLLAGVIAAFERTERKACEVAGSVLELGKVLPVLASAARKEAARVLPTPTPQVTMPPGSADAALTQLADQCATVGAGGWGPEVWMLSLGLCSLFFGGGRSFLRTRQL
jgi:hypothetical protein